jgi:DNA-binding GntR family transcriptional regulator
MTGHDKAIGGRMAKEAEETIYTSLVDKAYAMLREEIIHGDLRAGYPLMEQEIADRLNMSRTPVRVAIERLKHDGLVETIKRKGMLVKPLTATDVEQAYEVAEGLEGMLVKLTVLRASTAELEDLVNCVRAMVASAEAKDSQQWVVYDKQFHQKLLEFAQNPIIEASLARITTVIERVRFLHLSIGSAQSSSRDHLATVKAMAERDGEKARQLHQAHWQRIREEIVSFLRTNLGGEVLLR